MKRDRANGHESCSKLDNDFEFAFIFQAKSCTHLESKMDNLTISDQLYFPLLKNI